MFHNLVRRVSALSFACLQGEVVLGLVCWKEAILYDQSALLHNPILSTHPHLLPQGRLLRLFGSPDALLHFCLLIYATRSLCYSALSMTGSPW